MPKRPAAKYTTDFSGVRGIVPPRPHKYKKKRIHEEPAYGASTSSTSAMEESLRNSTDTEEDHEVQNRGLKCARQNRSFAKQVKKRLNKWHSVTGTPACVLFLKGDAVLCEGPAYLKDNFGKDKNIQTAFLQAVAHQKKVVSDADEASTTRVTLPPRGREINVVDLRSIVTSCVTMGSEGYTSPHWGKEEYKPCWWPDEIPYLAPKSGKSKISKKTACANHGILSFLFG